MIQVLPQIITETCEHPDLFTALCAASLEFAPIYANGDVKYKETAFSYADVHACIAAVKPALLKHGLVPSFDTQVAGKTVTSTFVLYHPKSGQIKRFSPVSIEAVNLDPKQIGSASTYGRRYAIVNALCLAVVEPEQEELDNCDKEGFESVKRGLPKEVEAPKEVFAPKDSAVKQLKEKEAVNALLADIKIIMRNMGAEETKAFLEKEQLNINVMPSLSATELRSIKQRMIDAE